jgi:CHAT domain-containing protein/tetratricopeptide (TPR) repeat protein
MKGSICRVRVVVVLLIAFNGGRVASSADLTVLEAKRFRETGQFAEAVRAYEQLLASQEQASGVAASQTLVIARALAETHRATGSYEQARALYVRCYQASEPEVRPTTLDLPQDLADLARVDSLAGNFQHAEQLLLQAIAERTSRLGAEHAAVADAQFALGRLYLDMNDAVAAQRCFETSLKIREAALPAQHAEIANSLMGLAESRFDQQNFGELETLYRRALAIRSALFKRPDPRISEVEGNLADFYLKVGRAQEGRELHESSMREAASASDQESRPAIVVRRRYANIILGNERYEVARKFLHVTLKNAQRALGPRDPEIPVLLARLALCYDSFGASEEAIHCYSQALAIVEQRYGPDSGQLTSYLSNLGFIYDHAGQAEQAERILRRCVEIQRSQTSAESFVSAINLAGHLIRRGKTAEALAEFDRGLHELRTLTVRMMPVMQDASQSYYLKQVYALLDVPLSAAVERPDDRAFVERSAEWAINLKQLAGEAAAEQELTARDTKDPQAGALARELAQIRQQLAALAPEQTRIASCAPTSQTLLALWRQERELAARLGELTQRRLLRDSWICLGEVRDRLAKDQVLIETALFESYDFRRWRAGPLRYVAWVIPAAGQGDVQLVDLGEAWPMQQAMYSYHRKLKATTYLLDHMSEADAAKPVDAAGQRLAMLLVAPLGKTAMERPRWLISADVILWLVPWAALPTGNGKYLVEDHEITYLVSGRDVVKQPAPRSAAPPVIVADPDYDWGLPAGAVGESRFAPLPSTAAEAAAIAPHLTQYTGKTPVTYSGANALESTVKAVHQPSVLVLSTHGYFRESDAPRESRAHPWLRCGVALAGANAAGTAAVTDGNDGILTGLEALGMDLRGTELVVLNACKTGLGDPTLSQGMTGLGQAFQLAGASSVVGTLWSIPDLPSSALASSFFRHLAGGLRKSEALRAAQLEMIKDRRHENQAAHPYYWAAFSITGSEN